MLTLNLPAPWRTVEASCYHIVARAPARHPIRHRTVELCLFDDGAAQVRNPESSYVMRFPDLARAMAYARPLVQDGTETLFRNWAADDAPLQYGWRARRDAAQGWGPIATSEAEAIAAVLDTAPVPDDGVGSPRYAFNDL